MKKNINKNISYIYSSYQIVRSRRKNANMIIKLYEGGNKRELISF